MTEFNIVLTANKEAFGIAGGDVENVKERIREAARSFVEEALRASEQELHLHLKEDIKPTPVGIGVRGYGDDENASSFSIEASFSVKETRREGATADNIEAAIKAAIRKQIETVAVENDRSLRLDDVITLG